MIRAVIAICGAMLLFIGLSFHFLHGGLALAFAWILGSVLELGLFWTNRGQREIRREEERANA